MSEIHPMNLAGPSPGPGGLLWEGSAGELDRRVVRSECFPPGDPLYLYHVDAPDRGMRGLPAPRRAYVPYRTWKGAGSHRSGNTKRLHTRGRNPQSDMSVAGGTFVGGGRHSR